MHGAGQGGEGEKGKRDAQKVAEFDHQGAGPITFKGSDRNLLPPSHLWRSGQIVFWGLEHFFASVSRVGRSPNLSVKDNPLPEIRGEFRSLAFVVGFCGRAFR